MKPLTLIEDRDIDLQVECVHVHKGSKIPVMETTHDKDLCTVSDGEKSQCSEANSHNVQCNVEHCSHSQGDIIC